MKNKRGVTLISLVITIIILIILAGVAISLSLGENGIFSKAKWATQSYANEQAKEETQIAEMENEINEYIQGGRSEKELQYSLNEQLVGRWITGKPLYQKTYLINKSFSELGYTSTYNFATENNIEDFLVVWDASIVEGSNTDLKNIYTLEKIHGQLSGHDWSYSGGVQYSIKDGKLNFVLRTTEKMASCVLKCITIRYTKTTDNAITQ